MYFIFSMIFAMHDVDKIIFLSTVKRNVCFASSCAVYLLRPPRKRNTKMAREKALTSFFGETGQPTPNTNPTALANNAVEPDDAQVQ